MSANAIQLSPDPARLLPHSGDMRMLSSVLGWTNLELAGRIDVQADTYLAGPNGVTATLATEYLAQCSAALFTVLALASEADAQPRPGMLIASRSLTLTQPTFTQGPLLGVVQAQSVLPEDHSDDAILVRFAGTLSTLDTRTPQDAPMIQHQPGQPALSVAALRERATASMVARAEFSVYLPAVNPGGSAGDTDA